MFTKLVAVSAIMTLPGMAGAAIITAGNVSLGVDTLGQLNVGGGMPDVAGTSEVGVRWISPEGDQYESTSHGCLCEGWGVSLDGTTSGYANNSAGSGGLTSLSFTNTATAASSVTQITGTDVQVTHSFALAAETDNLYRVTVTVANTGATDVGDVTYRRAMDWDTSPTPFSEYVTIKGTATTALLTGSSDDGFVTSDPLVALTSDLAGCGITTDFTACGPYDHGAAFDFNLGTLLAGEAYTFDIFYGGAANKTAALTALGAVGAELYSFGWSSLDANQDGWVDGDPTRRTPTFIFAFKGVGGEVVVPPATVPVPAAGLLLIGGLGALTLGRRRRS